VRRYRLPAFEPVRLWIWRLYWLARLNASVHADDE
jgi:hypothetical protein